MTKATPFSRILCRVLPCNYRKSTFRNSRSRMASMSCSDASPKLPLVATNLWYHVGSKNEERNQRGFAHLLRTSDVRRIRALPRRLLQALAAAGRQHQRLDLERPYRIISLICRRAHLELVLAMESDRMAHLVPALDESKLSNPERSREERIPPELLEPAIRHGLANPGRGPVPAPASL